MSKSDEDFDIRDRYYRNSISPQWYMNHAMENLESARILSSNKNAPKNVIYLLYGYATELFLKATYYAKNPENKEVKSTHDFVFLSKECEISLSENQKDILSLLSKYVVFAGRYPVAKDKDKQEEFDELFRKCHTEESAKIGNLSLFKYTDKKTNSLNVYNIEEIITEIATEFDKYSI
ncbi:HEPN domain-containing protein [Francisella philomiragia]|uniref:HEPN domain-containing protein n=1 Tax=Francisella philomiragia TaxID=28110 RepID=UPI001B8D3241|nr:HEPN domain-containing protein [Francisella philomiragia]QUE32185.1 HEPN domain-containing protein [Francisella philomiragia]